ncbi:hypothetical protein [Polynucleobacter sp. AP-Reno-20A-A9]|uniref:hypothetical protein n=1 Tax=Polynucleobacter sp. AP-Reno-20A-A9 TaxID=2576925 RepID=UPI001C0CC1A1|nr:hypothetical protein [Polynucleobacter sp. AP-Reno-20A-A9]MBU3629156.1 hypothetical protein [Polynucleobacter sp. AP-Reno-20A-A9]
MKQLLISILLLFATLSGIAKAGEKIAVQNWVAELNGQVNEAYTVNGPQSSFGMFCSGEQCLFYLHQSLRCTPGEKYSVLMNGPPISSALTMECTQINGNLFQILKPFDEVLKGIQNGEAICFAVALQSGAFAVNRFSLSGANVVIRRVMQEAAQSKFQNQIPPTPAPQKSTKPDIKI